MKFVVKKRIEHALKLRQLIHDTDTQNIYTFLLGVKNISSVTCQIIFLDKRLKDLLNLVRAKGYVISGMIRGYFITMVSG